MKLSGNVECYICIVIGYHYHNDDTMWLPSINTLFHFHFLKCLLFLLLISLIAFLKDFFLVEGSTTTGWIHCTVHFFHLRDMVTRREVLLHLVTFENPWLPLDFLYNKIFYGIQFCLWRENDASSQGISLNF